MHINKQKTRKKASLNRSNASGPYSSRAAVRTASLTVEAAMIFPLFVLLWIPFLYLIRCCSLYAAQSAMCSDLAELFSDTGYFLERSELSELNETAYQKETQEDTAEKGKLPFSEELEEQIGTSFTVLEGVLELGDDLLNQRESLQGTAFKTALSELGARLCTQIMEKSTSEEYWIGLGAKTYPSPRYSEFFYSDGGIGNRISIVLTSTVAWPDPFGFFSDCTIVSEASARAFIGMTKEEDPAAETGGIEKETFYRIGNGRHYHRLSCYLIAKTTLQITRMQAEKNGYLSCDQCHPQTDYVWITDGGERYHTARCPHLFPDAAALSEEELQSGRYSPCAICMQGGEWFTH